MRSNIRSLHNSRSFLTGKRGWKAGILVLAFLIEGPLLGVAAQEFSPSAEDWQGPVPHYLFLIDTSYSMGLRLPMRSETQWQLAVQELLAYLQHIAGRYALAEFSDTDTFRLITPFTTNKNRVRSVLTRPLFWAATDIQDAVIHAQRYVKTVGLQDYTPVSIIVVSDAIDTRGALYSLPLSRTLEHRSDQEADITIKLLPVDLPYNPVVSARIRNWGLQNSVQPQATGSTSIDFSAESRLRFAPRSSSRGKGLRPLLFIIIAVFVLTAPACVFFLFRNGGNIATRGPQKESGPLDSDSDGQEWHLYSVHFIEYRRQSGNRERKIEFLGSKQGIPLNIGPNGFVQAEREACQAMITFEEEGLFLTSDTPLLINGVAVRRRKFRPGIIITFGSTRFTLIGITRNPVEKNAATPAGAFKEVPWYRFLLPAWAVGALLLIVLSYAVPGVDLRSTKVYAGDDSASDGVHRATAYLKFTPYDWQSEFVHPDSGRVAHDGLPANKAADGELRASFDGLEALKTIVGSWDGREWRFDGLEAEEPVDYLFLHAHPDDEALDFGGLLAKLEQDGERTAVVLFTDGEAGLSRGPERVAGSVPEVLKRVRIREASNSLRILGADLYIRLRLRNHPYSSQRQVMPIEQVYSAWGGYESVEAALVMLIEQLKPRVVVSPDGPTKAREHFEHEAVGQAVIRVLERMQAEKSATLPQRHMRLVDPMQQAVYSRFTGIDVLRPAWPHTESPRSVQNRALKAHQSQIDARIVGLEYTPLFDAEYYQVREYDE